VRLYQALRFLSFSIVLLSPSAMNRILVVAFTLLCITSQAFSETPDEEKLALAKSVQARATAGDISALQDLRSLPAIYSWPVLLAVFRKNRNDAAVTAKCAELAGKIPGGEEYFLNLLKREAANNAEYSEQERAIDCLLLNHDKTSVRTLCGTLDDFNPREMGPMILGALATINPPGSPMVPKGHEADAKVLAQWKEWMSANKGNYAAEAAPK
jgi:hypothetical protein